MKDARRPAPVPAILAGLVLLTLAAYSGLRNNGFITFDDSDYLTSNHAVAAGLTRQGILWAFTTLSAGNWHPLTWISHMLDVQLFGMRAGAHHLVGLAIHAANAALLFLILRGMTGALWRSALVAALFAVHPLHVESVAWASERKDLLFTLFGFLTLGAYLGYAKRPGTGRALSVVFLFALGLLCKPMLVTLPFLLMLLDWWPLGRSSLPRPLWREKLPLFALAAGSCAVTWLAQSRGEAFTSGDLLPLEVRLANALLSCARYLGAMLWPRGLTVFYPLRGALPAWWLIAGAVLILGGISYLGVRTASRRPWLAVGWLWYLGSLVPVIGIVQVGGQAMADRYTYLPLVGIFLMVAWGLESAAEGVPALRMPALAAVLAILALLTATTRVQVGYWRDSLSLFRHALVADPENWVAYNNVGLALMRQEKDAKESPGPGSSGAIEDAIASFREAVRINPRYAEAHNNLGNALAEQGKTAEAIAHYRAALQTSPRFAAAHNNLGNALAEQGNPSEAIASYRAALAIDPRLAEAYNNLGAALAAQGNLADAAAAYRTALGISPRYAQALNNLGLALAAQGNFADAAVQYRLALREDPNLATAANNLGIALASQGNLAEAVTWFREATKKDPRFAAAHLNLGMALAESGRFEEAVERYRDALAIKPDLAQAWRELGEASGRLNRLKAAEAAFRKAQEIEGAQAGRPR